MLMNILFAVGSVMISLVLATLIYALTPLSDYIPRKVFATGLSIVTLLVIFYSVQTYGPRNSLHDKPTVAYKPQVTEIAETEPFVEESHRVGQFDDDIDDAPQ